MKEYEAIDIVVETDRCQYVRYELKQANHSQQDPTH